MSKQKVTKEKKEVNKKKLWQQRNQYLIKYCIVCKTKYDQNML